MSNLRGIDRTTARIAKLHLVALAFLLCSAAPAFADTLGVSQSALTFNAPLGSSSPASQPVQVTSTASGVSFSVAVATSSGGNWLSYGQTSSSTPGTLNVFVNPAAVPAVGTYNGTLTITAAGLSGSPAVVNVTFTVTTDALTLSQSALTFSAPLGSSSPALQPVQVTSTASGVSFSVAVATSSGGSWLSYSQTSCSTPGTLYVFVNPAAVPAGGTYNGTLTITAAGLSGSPAVVHVTFNVTTDALTLSQSALTFSAPLGSSSPAFQPVQVTSTASGVSFSVAAATSSGGNWLSYGQTSSSTPGTLNVFVNPAAVPAVGTYNGTLTITAAGLSGSPAVVNVTFTVTTDALTLSQSALTFSAPLGSSSPAFQPVQVTSTASGVSFSVAAATSSGGNWLSYGQTSSSTPGTLNAFVNPAAVPAGGTYNGTLTITAAGLSGSPAVVHVTFNVTTDALTLSQSALTFSAPLGSSSPAFQPVQVTSTASGVSFSVAAATSSGGNWLSYGQTSSSTPGTLNVFVNPAAVPAVGTYNGTLTITAAGLSGSPAVVNVTFTVTTDALTLSQSALTFSAPLGSSSPAFQPVQVTSTASGVSFSVAAATSSGGNWLSYGQTSSSTPGTLNAFVNPAAVPAGGTYNGTLTITAAGLSGSPAVVHVTFNVTTDALTLSQSALTFSAPLGSSSPAFQPVQVTSTASGVSFSVAAATSSGGNWLSYGQTSSSTPGTLNVFVNPAAVPAGGTYNGTLTITAAGLSGSPAVVNVTFTVTTDALTLSQSALTFSAPLGSSSPALQPVQVTSTASGVSFSVAAATSSGGNWLSYGQTSSSTPGTLNVFVNPAAVPAGGTYNGTLTITAAGLSGSPAVVHVTFNVTTDALTLSQSALTFSAPLGSSSPAFQPVQVTSTASGVSFSVAAATSSGGNWLSYGQTSSSTPGTLNVFVNPAAVPAVGTYNGTLTITAAGLSGSPAVVNVTFTATTNTLNVLTTSGSITLPNGTVGSPYAGATLTAQGGTLPYSWTATSLPPGLILSSPGVLGGTPTAAGVYSTTFTVVDSSSPIQTAQAILSITINSTALLCPSAAFPSPVINLLRIEGTTEEVSDATVSCAAGSTVTSGAVTLTLNAAVTSKAVNGATDATLLVTPSGRAAVAYFGTVSGSTITFGNVAFPASAFVVSLKNIRVNASATASGSQITEAVLVTSGGATVLAGSAVSVGLVGQGFAASAVSGVNNYSICQGSPAGVTPAGTVTIAENAGGAFKSQTPAGLNGSQVCGGSACSTTNGEQGTYTPGGDIGTATHGTRFQLAFANLNAAVTLSVPLSVTNGTLTMQLTASAAGPFSPLSSGVLTTSAGGTAFAYYEVTQTDNTVPAESVAIPVTATAAANFSMSPVPAFTVTVTVAPQNSADIPDFSTPTPASLTLSAYTACSLTSQTITFPQPNNVTYGSAPVALNATASSMLPVSYISSPSTVCTIAGSTAVVAGAGTCSVTASQAGNTSFASAPNVTDMFTVAKATQTITFAPLANMTFGAAPFAAVATASSSLPVSFGSTTGGVCGVSGAVVTLITTGTCTISASQAGNNNFLAAASVQQSFTVNPNIPPLTLSCTSTTGPATAGTPYSSTCSASGGRPGYVFLIVVGALPTGLTIDPATGTITGMPTAGGTYNYSIEVEDSETPPQTASQSYSGRIATSITVSPAILSFNFRIGDVNAPSPETVSVFTIPPGVRFSAAASVASGGNWLSIQTPANPTTPAAFPVSINIAGLNTAGQLNGTVTITPAGGGTPVDVPVVLNVLAAAPPNLSATPMSESFTLTQGSSTSGQITILNTGSGTLGFSSSSDQSWLTTSDSGSASAASPGIVGFTINSAGLTPGLNTANVTITGAARTGEAVVTVNVVVSQNSNSIQISQSSLNFTPDSGGSAPPAQSVTISNPGSGTLNWTASASTSTGGPWLKLTPSGTSIGGQTGTVLVASIDPAVLPGLASGQYYGTATISANGAANTPQAISVLLTVQTAGTKGAGITFSSGGLILSGTAGGAATTGQVSLFNPSSTAGSYSITTVMNQGTGWLSVVGGASGTLSPGTNTLTIQANPGALASGAYKGAVTMAFDDGTTASIQVALLVKGASPAAVPRIAPLPVQAACVGSKPSYLVPNFTQPLNNATTQVAVGQLVRVQLVDDCNTPVTVNKGGGAQVTFGNGDPALSLSDVGGGFWEGTWSPITAGSQGTLQVVALVSSTGPSPLAGVSSINTSVNAPSPTGASQLHGVVNAASGSAATPQIVAPGSFVAIYGILLASGSPVSGSTLPLSTMLSDTQLLLGGQPLPLSYASAGQVNALIPQNLNPNASYSLVVKRGSTQSVPTQVNTVSVEPGIYTANQSGTGQGVIQIANTSLLAQPTGNGSRPVKSGSEFLTIYATGLGAVVGTKGEPQPADGAPALLPTIYQTKATVTVTIGGVTVPASFSGLTPTLAALYQVNVPVPDGVPTGDAVPITITATSPDGSVAQSNTVTIAIQ